MLAKILKKDFAAGLSGSPRFCDFSLEELSPTPSLPSAGLSAYVFPSLASVDGDRPVTHFAGSSSEHEFLFTKEDAAQETCTVGATNRRNIEESAYEKALADALSTIDAEVAERTASEIEQMRELLAASIHTISSLSSDITARTESEIVKLAIEIARKIVEREITIDPEVAISVVKRSLDKLHDRSVAEIRLHPVDLSYVRAHQDRLGFRGSLELKEDVSISPGGCIVQTDSGDIDARIESQFEEIASGLFNDGTLLNAGNPSSLNDPNVN